MEIFAPANLFRELEAWSNQCGRGGEKNCSALPGNRNFMRPVAND